MTFTTLVQRIREYARTFGLLALFLALILFYRNATEETDNPRKIEKEMDKIKTTACIPLQTFEDDRSQFDNCLINFVRDTYIIAPPVTPLKLNDNPPKEILRPVLAILKLIVPQGKGFFVDSGASDGEYNSNTLVLERDYQWTGILIEPDKAAFQILKSKRRNAMLANLCISPTKTAKRLEYYVLPGGGSNVNSLSNRTEFGKTTPIKIECVPLYSILKAINVSTIDFFSLDIETMELPVLKTIPFDEIFIKVLQVENRLPAGEYENFNAFMASKNFSFIRKIEELGSGTKDQLFVHHNYLTNLTDIFQ